MTLWITPFGSRSLFGREPIPAPLTGGFSLTSAAGVFPPAGTKMIGVSGDAGAFLGFNSTVIAANSTVSSTNGGIRIPANQRPLFFAVSTINAINAQST